MSLGFAASLFVAVAIAPLIALGAVPARADGTINQCLDCHATPARLVPAIREIERNSRGLPGGSTEFEGEG